jgi:large repetitive protein
MSIRIRGVMSVLALAVLFAGACSSSDPDQSTSDSPSTDSKPTSTTTAPDEVIVSDLPAGPLDPPVDISVQIDNSDVILEWSDPTNPEGVAYLVARDGRELATVTDTSYRDQGLADGAYRYLLFAVGADGPSSASDQVVAQVGAPDLFPPSDPTAVEIKVINGKVLITWNASLDDRGVRGYLIHRNHDFYAWVTGELKFVDDDIDENQTYRYRVRAQDDAANVSAPVGGIVSTGPPDTMPPSAPAGLEVSVEGNVVTIDWADSTDDREIWGYLVHRDGIFHAWVDDKTEFSETVVAGSTHKYVIRAQDGAGNNSGPSETLDIAVG